MPDFLKNISNQITEYLNKYTTKQKIKMGLIIVVAIASLAALIYFLTRPQFILYADDLSPTEMNQVIDTLKSNNVLYKYEDNASKLYVETSKYQEVKLMLAKEGILSTKGFKWADAFNSSLTTTSGERNMMQQLAFENEISEYLASLKSVSDAKVKFVLPQSDNVVLKKDEEASASIILTLSKDLTEEQVYGIALWVSDLVNNLSIENIKILESKTSKLLFNGNSNKLGGASSYLETTNLYERKYEKDLELLLYNSGGVDDAIVDVNLEIDYSQLETEDLKYSLPENMDKLLPEKVYTYESNGTAGVPKGIPGTDSNEDTTDYVVNGGGSSDSSVNVNDTKYAIDTKRVKKKKAAGNINHSKSSVSVVLRKYKQYDEKILTDSGELADMTWEQYKQDNKGETKLEVSDEIVQFVKNATRIDNVSILLYEVPVFNDIEKKQIDYKSYIPVAIIVIMIALLGYAVYRSTDSTEVTEVEPELSVEEMLATTGEEEEQLEEIDLDEKSPSRKQIEHLVDEKPEVMAQLLRNWLNDDWK